MKFKYSLINSCCQCKRPLRLKRKSKGRHTLEHEKLSREFKAIVNRGKPTFSGKITNAPANGCKKKYKRLIFFQNRSHI